MLTRTRLIFLILIVFTLFMAMAPGTITGLTGSGDDDRHVLAFAVLPVAGAVAWPRLPLWPQFLGYAALGGGIELAQWAMHRWHSAEWSDWFLDMAAAAVALSIVWLARRRLARP
jgi:hypothetical protein